MASLGEVLQMDVTFRPIEKVPETPIRHVFSVEIYKKSTLFGKREVVEVMGSDAYGILNITLDFKTGKILKQEEVNSYDMWTIPKRPDYKRKAMPY